MKVYDPQKHGNVLDFISNDGIKLLDPPYEVNQERKRLYKEALDLLLQLPEEKLNFTFDNPDFPYFIHGIYIQWKTNGEEVILEGKEIAEILSKVGTLSIEDNAFWTLHSEIYRES